MAVGVTHCAFKQCPHLKIHETSAKAKGMAPNWQIRSRSIFRRQCTLAGLPPNQIYRCPLESNPDAGTEVF